MHVSNQSVDNLALTSWVWLSFPETIVLSAESDAAVASTVASTKDVLAPLRQWLDRLDVRDLQLAHRICQLIPAQCPFERDICFLGRCFLHIPPLCKLNPLYEQLVALRFRALCYLADECGEDISCYC
jgi:hypothetical protein